MNNESGSSGSRHNTADGKTSSSSSSEEASSPASGVGTRQQQRHASGTSPELKRFAAKELIERYFYQLLRGCGNPKCSNVHCASSGKVATMTPNEIAAKAIQLFSQDAKLCDVHNSEPTSSHCVSVATTPIINDAEMLSPTDSSTSTSSNNSTITSGSSSSSTTSTESSTNNTNTTASTNTNISSCITEKAPLLETTLSTDTTLNAHQNQHAAIPRINNITSSSAAVVSTHTPTLTPVAYLNEQLLELMLEECKKCNNYDRLLHAINEVYSSIEKLSESFCRPKTVLTQLTSGATATKLQELLGKSPNDFKKEDLRTLEGENDKDEDSTCCTIMEDDDDDEPCSTGGAAAISDTSADLNEPMEDEDELHAVAGVSEINSQSSDTMVDLESLRRVKKKLFALNNPKIGEALNSNIVHLAESIKYRRDNLDWEKVLHCFVICFDMATNTSNTFADLEYLECSLPKLCHAARILPVPAQARLARIWAAHCKDQLQSLVQCCQQLISLQVILDEETVQDNTDVMAVTRVLKIAFYANILAGHLDMAHQQHSSVANAETVESDDSIADANIEDDDIFSYSLLPKSHQSKFAEDKLEKELNVTTMDCRVPLVPYSEFYNEPLSDAIQMDRDYLSYRNLSLHPSDAHFSFMLYSFILTPATKVIALYYDSRIRMYSERNSSLYSLLNYYGGDNNDAGSLPDLKLKVRRENIIDDALIGLELVAMSNPKDLKKQLVVEFVGEQGIDEGGVSKEFFQLIVEEIFNPDFGMFTHQEDTNTVWFNSAPFENEAQFTLIGIILGLAIYNNIILAVNFPMVVYRKLMGGKGTFYDLEDWNPTLYRSLKSLLDYQEPDMEEVFMQTFKISYKNVFGEIVEHELKPSGGDIIVDQHNKQEFVDLYSDYLLNKSIERQFKAFKKGFEMVTDESPLKLLFRPEEIELLVCGSRKFDFVELEKSTEYEGGYTKDTQVIKDFWSVVHSMPEESKRKLLEFTTGSDRVPVGGLSRLKLLITRHGPDSDRLPTSHTCFNVLLLPEYSSKEKLEERLLKAINYSKGFGML